MKNLSILLAVVMLGAVNAMAQPGTFGFVNDYGFNNKFPLTIATGTDAASLAAATVIGTDPTSESLGAGPGQVNIELFMALNGTVPQFALGTALPPVNFFLAGTATNYGSFGATAQGTFNGTNPYTVPATLDNGAFTKGTAIEYDFYAITQNGNFAGLSDLGSNYILAGGPALPAEAFGTGAGQIGGWTLVPIPEPSSIVLSSLGVAALLLNRFRKLEFPQQPTASL